MILLQDIWSPYSVLAATSHSNEAIRLQLQQEQDSSLQNIMRVYLHT